MAELLLGEQLDFKCVHNFERYLILQVEHVVETAVIALCPQMSAGRSIDQLCIDADPAPSLPNTALQHVGDAKLLRDALKIHRLSLVGENGVAAENKEARHLREIGNDVLGDSITEKFLVRVIAHVGEGQHRYRRPTCCHDAGRHRCLGQVQRSTPVQRKTRIG